MPPARFFGIDFASSPRHPAACVGLDDNLDLAIAVFLLADEDILLAARTHRPDVIAVDAPLSLPAGMCCLDPACSCHGAEGLVGRDCERELARAGIPCYFTTKRSIVKPMAQRGIRLKALLQQEGHRVIETYPYASKVLLWGKPIPRKSQHPGLRFLQQRLACAMPSLQRYIAGFDHDLCDATVAAYTAYLECRGETRCLGNAAEGTIFVPRQAVCAGRQSGSPYQGAAP